MLGDQAEPDQSAPILTDKRDAGEVESVEEHRPHPLDMASVGVVGLGCRFVGASKADQIGGDHPKAGVYEDRDHLAVEEGPRRFAVEREHHRALLWTFI